MSYDNELRHLYKEHMHAKTLHRNTDDSLTKYRMKHDVETIEFQINVFKKAAKVDEYEAKAKAFDRVREKVYARINHIIMTSSPDQRKPGYVDGLYNALDIISEELEVEEESEWVRLNLC